MEGRSKVTFQDGQTDMKEVSQVRCKESKSISEEGWIDVGAKASMWGGIDNAATCHTNAEAIETRRDYMIVNLELLPRS